MNGKPDNGGLGVLYQTLITFSSGDCQIAIQFPFAEYTGNLAKTMASFFIGFFGCFPRYLASEKISYPALPHAFIMDDFE